MAGNSKYSVLIEAKIKDGVVEKQLDTISKNYVFNIKAKIDLSQIEEQVKNVSTKVSDLQKKATTTTTRGTKTKLVDVSDDIRSIEALKLKIEEIKKATQGSAFKVDVFTEVDEKTQENIRRAIFTYADGMGDIKKETYAWRAELDGAGNVIEDSAKWINVANKYTDDGIRKAKQLTAERKQEANLLERMTKQYNLALANVHGRKQDVPEVKAVLDVAANLKQAIESKDIENMKKFSNELQVAQRRMGNLGKDTLTWNKALKVAFERIVQWGIATGVIYGALRKFREMVGVVKELDTALTELQKVSNLAGVSLRSFTDVAFDMASRVGKTGTEAIDAVTEFVRAGYAIKDALVMGEAALIMTNVAEGITNVDDATSSLIAVLKGFNMEANQTQAIVDKLNQVSNTTASGFDQLADGLRRTSGTLSQTGTTIDELLGLLVGGIEPLRDVEMVSSGLLMISQRLRGIGEDGEKVAGLLPKLQDEFIEIAGISIIDPETGGLRSTYDILSDMARVFPTLTDQQKMYLAELSAGNRQVKVLNAILANWQNVEKAVNSAKNSTGSALRENEKYLDSIQGKLSQLESAWQMLSKNTLDSEWMKTLIEFGTEILKIVDNLGLLNIAIVALSTVIMTKAGGAVNFIIALINTLSDVLTGAAISTAGLSAALQGIGVGLVIIGIIKLFDELKVTAQETREEFEKLRSMAEENTRELASLAEEYEILATKQKRTREETARILDIQTILNTKYLDSANKIDIYTAAIENNSKAIRENIKWMKEQELQQYKNYLERAKLDYEGAKKKLSEKINVPYTLTLKGGEDYSPRTREEMLRFAAEHVKGNDILSRDWKKYHDKLRDELDIYEDIVIEYEKILHLVQAINREDSLTLPGSLRKGGMAGEQYRKPYYFGPKEEFDVVARQLEDLDRKFRDLESYISGPLANAYDDFISKQENLTYQVAELEARIAEASSYPPSLERDQELFNLRQQLEETNQAIYDNATAYEMATKRIIFSITLQRIAQMDMNAETQLVAYDMVYKLGQAWGLMDQQTIEAVRIIDSALFSIANGGGMQAAQAAIIRLGELALSISGDYYIRFLVSYQDTGPMDPAMADQYESWGAPPPIIKKRPEVKIPPGGFYPGGFGGGGGGGGSREDTFSATMRDLYNLVINKIKEENNARKETLKTQQEEIKAQQNALKDQLEGYEKIIDARKEILRTQAEELRYHEQIADKNKSIARLQEELAILALDTSLESKARQLELQDELTEEQEDLERMQRDYRLQKQEEALDKSYEDYKEYIEKQNELLEAQHDDIEKQIEAIDEFLSKSGLVAQEAFRKIAEQAPNLYQSLIDWNREYGSGIDNDVTRAWNEAYDALKHYSDLYLALLGESEYDRPVLPLPPVERHHSGLASGPVGGIRTPTNEVFTRLLAGEVVLNNDNMLSIINKIPQIARNLQTVSTPPGITIAGNLVNIEGNADQDTVRKFEKEAKRLVDYMNKVLLRQGITRSAVFQL